MKTFLIQTAAFLIWCFTLLCVSIAPLVLDTPEAIAAILVSGVAAFAVGMFTFWNV